MYTITNLTFIKVHNFCYNTPKLKPRKTQNRTQCLHKNHWKLNETVKMDQSQNQRSLSTTTPSRSVQFHPARVPILDLFNLYLGLGVSFFLLIFFPRNFLLPNFFSTFIQRNSRNKPDDSLREPP
jgi:hypothetical protein